VVPLTAAALAAVPARHAGMASAVNNDVARTAALIAVAVLPAAAGLTGTAYLHPRAVLGRIRPGITHLGRPVPSRRRTSRTHHPQPRPAGPPGTAAVPALRPGRTSTTSRRPSMTSIG
jgi:hypothetical protein